MPTTYTDLIADIRKRTKQVSLEEIKRRLEAHEKMTLVDVREKDEWRAGYIPGAVSIPRGFLEIQAEQKLPDKNARIVAYCAGGTRSALAAATLQELGYTNVETANPGFVRWKDLELPDGAAGAAHRRAARALLAPHPPARGGRGGAGAAPPEQGAPARRGRARLARGALPGGGGRGHARASSTPTWSTRRTCSGRSSTRRAASGTPKVESAAKAIADLNPDVKVVAAPGAPEQRERRSHLRATTRSSSTGPTTSRRATSSTTRASSSASRSCTEASSASTGR